MIKSCYILSLLILSITTNAQAKNAKQEQKVFEDELGVEKVKALNGLIKSFDLFLNTNFSEESEPDERLTRFLKQLAEDEKDFIFRTPSLPYTLKQAETSGLRKDIYLFDTEEEGYVNKNPEVFFNHEEEKEPFVIPDLTADFEELEKIMDITIEPIDTRREYMNFNTNGLFLYAMAKAKQKDTTFMQGLEALWQAGDTSPGLLLQGQQLMTEAEKTSWEYKVMVAILIYSPAILQKFGR